MKKGMRNKRGCLLAVWGLTVLCLTGCGNKIPDMTQAQISAIGEYTAGLLLSYDANHKSRLVDLTLVEENRTEEENQTEEEKVPEAEEKPSGMLPTEETPAISTGEDIENVPMEQALGLPEGITVTYQGERITDSYPDEESEEIYFSVDAVEGKKLLVLDFVISNQTSEEQTLDIFSRNLLFKVTVNDSYTRNSLNTMLVNDLSTYMNTIPAGESAEAVLLVEVEEDTAETIAKISLKVKNEDTNSTIYLK